MNAFQSSLCSQPLLFSRVTGVPLATSARVCQCSVYHVSVQYSRDCSSIGQSTALSRRKLRVRAPSFPTQDLMYRSINLSSVTKYIAIKKSQKQNSTQFLSLQEFLSVSEERSLLEEGCQEESKRPTRVSSEKRFIYNINYYRSKPKAKCIDRFPCVGREIE